MRLLVADVDAEPGGFAWTVPRELVRPYDDNTGPVDCEASRVFVGLATHCGTTAAEVAELDVDQGELAHLVAASLADAGWTCTPGDAESIAAELVALGERWPVGTLVRRRRETVEPR